jgi:hypothetical protein
LYLVPKPSRTLVWAVIAVHVLALIAAMANPLPLSARVLVASAVMVSSGLNVRRIVLQPSVSAILLRPGGDWHLILNDGKTVAAALQPTTVVTVWFTLLHLRTDAGLRTVLLCRDSLDPESYRLLRVALKVGELPNRQST